MRALEKINQTLAKAGEALLAWLPGAAWKLLEILLALLISWVLYRLLKRSIIGIIRRLNANRAIPTSERKLNTICNLSLLLLRVLIVFFAIVAVFNLLGLTGVLTSVVATAGVGGLLIAFGAQSIVKDFIAGLLLTMEDQITLGDFVEVNGISGTVEGLTIRTVQIRGFRGELYTIHAGSITMVTNYSRNSPLSEQDALAVADVCIPKEAHIPLAISAVADEANRWAQRRPDIVHGSPTVLGATKMSDLGVIIRVTCKVEKSAHSQAELELRAQLEQRLNADGTHILKPEPENSPER